MKKKKKQRFASTRSHAEKSPDIIITPANLLLRNKHKHNPCRSGVSSADQGTQTFPRKIREVPKSILLPVYTHGLVKTRGKPANNQQCHWLEGTASCPAGHMLPARQIFLIQTKDVQHIYSMGCYFLSASSSRGSPVVFVARCPPGTSPVCPSIPVLWETPKKAPTATAIHASHSQESICRKGNPRHCLEEKLFSFAKSPEYSVQI